MYYFNILHNFSNLVYIYIFFLFGSSDSRLLCGLFSSCGREGCYLVAVRGLLIAVASPVGLQSAGFGSCGPWAQQLWLLASGAQAQ